VTRRRPRIRSLLLAVCALPVLVSACGDDSSSARARELRFEVVPEYLDEPYENAELGLALRPPLGWRPLDDEQRRRVSEALIAAQEDGEYSLEIVDVFLHTETLRFAALSTVSQGGVPAEDTERYVDSLAEALGPEEDYELRVRGRIRVNGLEATQFRHRRDDRVTFTLVFRPPAGMLTQLDYSIPVSAYEDEGIKLESSVGTLQPIAQE